MFPSFFFFSLSLVFEEIISIHRSKQVLSLAEASQLIGSCNLPKEMSVPCFDQLPTVSANVLSTWDRCKSTPYSPSLAMR
jgi:hypothetical protein